MYLGEQEFYVDKGTKGPVICCTMKGIVFVMFHANPQVCQFCDLAKPEFMQLAQIIPGAKFGLCNLSQYPGLVQMSYKTITPLNKVPLFILFVNGRPFMNYEGQKQIKPFAEFMQQALARLQSQQVFSSGGAETTASAEELERTPHGLAYDYDYVTISNPNSMGGVTCTEEGVCYLTSKEALGSTEPPKPQQQQPQMQQYQQQRPYFPQQQQQPPMYQQQQFMQQQQQPMFQQQPYYPQQQRMPTGNMYTQAQQNYMPQRQQQPYYPPQQQQFYQR